MKDFLIPKDIPKHEALKAMAARYPDLDPSAVEACITMFRVSGDLFGCMNGHFARYGLSQGRFIIMVLLNKSPDLSLSPSELADMSCVSRATVTGLLDGLERDGLVKRVFTPDDRRSYSVCLTHKGKKVIDKVLPDHFRRLAGVMANLSETERNMFVRLLFKVRDGLTALKTP